MEGGKILSEDVVSGNFHCRTQPPKAVLVESISGSGEHALFSFVFFLQLEIPKTKL